MERGLIERLIDGISPEGRYLCRFSAKKVGEEIWKVLIGAARVAPSADNLQTWRFIIVEGDARFALSDAVNQQIREAVKNSPLVIVVLGIKALITRVRREQPFIMIDVPIAMTHILFMASEMGLVCQWTLDCDEAKVRQILSIPSDVRIVGIIALGLPE